MFPQPTLSITPALRIFLACFHQLERSRKQTIKIEWNKQTRNKIGRDIWTREVDARRIPLDTKRITELSNGIWKVAKSDGGESCVYVFQLGWPPATRSKGDLVCMRRVMGAGPADRRRIPGGSSDQDRPIDDGAAAPTEGADAKNTRA